MAFVSGPYTATYDGSSIGISERGWEIEQTWFGEPIIGDNMGDSIQDNVYRGGNCFFSSVLQEFNIAKVRRAFWPYATNMGWSGVIGCNDIAVNNAMTGDNGQLVLNVVTSACSGASVYGPSSVTVPHAHIAKNFPIRITLGATHRKVPIRLQAYPTSLPSGSQSWFSTTGLVSH